MTEPAGWHPVRVRPLGGGFLGPLGSGGVAALNHRLMAATPPASNTLMSQSDTRSIARPFQGRVVISSASPRSKPQRRLKIAVARVALPSGVGGAVEEAAREEVGKAGFDLEAIRNDFPAEAGFHLLAHVASRRTCDILDATAGPGVFR